MYGDGSYDDGAKFPGFGWLMKGGDTLIVKGAVSTMAGYRIGWEKAGDAYDCSGKNHAIRGLCGNPFDSSVPPPPNGTADHPTRILGENYANCSAESVRTPLRGGGKLHGVLDLRGVSHVDVECLDLSDFRTTPDDTAQIGIMFNNKSTHVLIKNVRAHGFSGSGLWGPTGDDVTLDHIDIVGNHSSGWNTDDGTAGVGHLTVTNFSISWNGCLEEKPIAHSLPYTDCRDDDNGGYGDGFGTATKDSPPPGWQVVFDHGEVAYNTQDGLDALHVSGPGSTMTIKNVIAYGNMGQQLKVGTTAVIEHNLIVANCAAMRENIPGTPPGFNQHLSDWCRANNTAIAFLLAPGKTVTYEYNTLFDEGLVGLELEYVNDHPSPDIVARYDHNVFIGFRNQNHEYPSPVYSNTDLNMFKRPGSSFDSNITFRAKSDWHCPERSVNETNGSCADPHLPDESRHAYGYPKIGAPGVVNPPHASSATPEPPTPDTPRVPHPKRILVGVGGIAAASIAALALLRSNAKS